VFKVSEFLKKWDMEFSYLVWEYSNTSL
jgi:hypothetical protein